MIFCYTRSLVPSPILIREASSSSLWGHRPTAKHYVELKNFLRRREGKIVGARRARIPVEHGLQNHQPTQSPSLLLQAV